jgi:hypothetical protein
MSWHFDRLLKGRPATQDAIDRQVRSLGGRKPGVVLVSQRRLGRVRR